MAWAVSIFAFPGLTIWACLCLTMRHSFQLGAVELVGPSDH